MWEYNRGVGSLGSFVSFLFASVGFPKNFLLTIIVGSNHDRHMRISLSDSKSHRFEISSSKCG